MGQILTDTMLRRLATPSSGRVEVWDSKIPGFGLRVSQRGVKAFVLFFRHRGRKRRMTLGRYPYLSLVGAREKATAALREVSEGRDPTLSVAEERSGGQEFNRLVEDFVEKHCGVHNKASTAKETERLLTKHFVSEWGSRDVRDITQQHVSDIIKSLMDDGLPSEANHALAVLKTFFSWCQEQGLVSENPSDKVKKPGKKLSRSRVLADDEIVAVWNSFEAEGYPFGDMGKLLLLTGQRRGEVIGMGWREIDQARALWIIPKERAKNGREHTVPLSGSAMKLLSSVPKFGTHLVFPARGNSDNSVSGFTRAKQRFDELSSVSDWTLHDLRRTVATGMAGIGIPPHVIERVLNHVSGSFGGVAGIYNRYQYVNETRDALEKWSQHLTTIRRVM